MPPLFFLFATRKRLPLSRKAKGTFFVKVLVQPDKELITHLGKTDATRALVIGNSVYDPLLFSRRLIHFSRRQYLFLNEYRLGIPLNEAASKAGMTVAHAERFLKRPKIRAWLEDRAKKDYIRNEWSEPGKWWEMGDKVLKGEKHLSKDQQVVWMAFGERIAPKPRELGGPSTGPTINFNFSPEAVKEAFRRQESIKTELENQV